MRYTVVNRLPTKITLDGRRSRLFHLHCFQQDISPERSRSEGLIYIKTSKGLSGVEHSKSLYKWIVSIISSPLQFALATMRFWRWLTTNSVLSIVYMVGHGCGNAMPSLRPLILEQLLKVRLLEGY